MIKQHLKNKIHQTTVKHINNIHVLQPQLWRNMLKAVALSLVGESLCWHDVSFSTASDSRLFLGGQGGFGLMLCIFMYDINWFGISASVSLACNNIITLEYLKPFTKQCNSSNGILTNEKLPLSVWWFCSCRNWTMSRFIGRPFRSTNGVSSASSVS